MTQNAKNVQTIVAALALSALEDFQTSRSCMEIRVLTNVSQVSLGTGMKRVVRHACIRVLLVLTILSNALAVNCQPQESQLIHSSTKMNACHNVLTAG